MNNKPLLHYDSKSDTIYIVTRKGKEEEFIEVAPGINVEFNKKGEVVGIEILDASRFLKPIAKPLYQHMQIA